MQLPTLFHKGKGGDLRQWRVWTEGANIYTEHGLVNGQLQISCKEAEPKNIGRSNETSPEEQAELEAASMWKYKVERKYSETPEGAEEQLPLPMLAHGFKGTKRKKFSYPADVQPKLDGVRCLAQRDGDEILLTSRQGKPWNIPHVAAALSAWMPEGMVLDGEIYVHGMSCQRITSLAKSADPDGKSFKPDSEGLIYHVYDMPTWRHDDSIPWKERAQLLYGYLEAGYGVERVEHTTIGSEDELWAIHGSYVAEGYEGAILRGHDGRYLWGYRSSELLKVKEFQDAEFEVIDARDGKGKMSGCVVWTCRNDTNQQTFECTMKITMDERRRMYEERDAYIGKFLTVRFFDRTDDEVPRFPVGIVFRDAYDLPK